MTDYAWLGGWRWLRWKPPAPLTAGEGVTGAGHNSPCGGDAERLPETG